MLTCTGWFRPKDTVIHSGEGPIYAIKWRGLFIAWANDIGVKIYDTSSNQRITYINRPKGSPRAHMHRCNLCWENDSTLLIGWADSIKIGQVKVRCVGL
jgi:vacuolar protein sorting-associated protein 41